MFSTDELPGLDRRELMRNAVLLVGGTLAASSPAASFAQSASKKPARFFSAAQYAVLAETVDIIIPRTDTPGAKDAGVPQAFDAMMRVWANAEHRAQYTAVIDDIGGMGLMKMKPAQRLELIRKYDADKLAARDANYRRFKDLTMTLYYLSEDGATKELRYELIPGKWEPWIEVTPATRTWAA